MERIKLTTEKGDIFYYGSYGIDKNKQVYPLADKRKELAVHFVRVLTPALLSAMLPVQTDFPVFLAIRERAGSGIRFALPGTELFERFKIKN